MVAERTWTLLTNHAAVLLTIYRVTVLERSEVRVRDIAESVGVTERTVQHILNDLEDGGYILRRRVGNRTHYEIHDGAPLPRPDEDVDVGALLTTLTTEAPRGDVAVGDTGSRRHGTQRLGAGLIAADHVTGEGIQRALATMRSHLDLDVAFVSRVRDGERTFVYVDADDPDGAVVAGGSDPAEESYCHYVINGRMPQLMVDPAQDPVASQLPATRELPVGTHLSVPIELDDSSVYGTCCGFSHEVKEHVGSDELAAVRIVARLVSGYLDQHETAVR